MRDFFDDLKTFQKYNNQTTNTCGIKISNTNIIFFFYKRHCQGFDIKAYISS